MKARGRLSLNLRLLMGLFVVSFCFWTAIAWVTIRDTMDETYQLFDAHLAQTALALMRVTDPDEFDPVAIPERSESPTLREIFPQWLGLTDRLTNYRAKHGNVSRSEVGQRASAVGSTRSLYVQYEKQLRYQIWDGKGHLLLRSSNAPTTRLTEVDGFSESTDAAGQTWRYYSVWDQHRDYRIQAAEAHDVRNRLVHRITVNLISPLVLGLPVLMFLLWLSINRGLDPLGKLAREISTRKPDNLTPLDVDDAPSDIRPAALAVNQLLQRMANTLESERLFTANAAHELRTPLAAIQAHLHAARAAEGEAERLRAMDQLQRGVERGIRLVGQLLTLARLDPEQALVDVEPVKLGNMAELVCAQLAPLALQRDQTLELRVEPDLAALLGNADMLSMLLGNLIDNAIRYTPRGGTIDVAIRGETSGQVMEVSDDGPGIPVAQRERVFDRFYRIAGQDQPGTGLGLAICGRIAQLHNARIVLADGPGNKGLTARVLLGEPASV